MKSCMVAYSFYESDNRVRRYAESLAKEGHEVEALSLRKPGQPSDEVINGVRVLRIQKRVIDEAGPFSYLKKLLEFFIRSAWVLTVRHLRARYDLIHVHSVPDFEVFATLIPRILGARVILDIHDIVPEFYAAKFRVSERSSIFRLLVWMEKLSAAYSDHVIIANHLWHKKITGRSVRPEKCTPLINYPDLSIFRYRPKSMPGNGEIVMCYPGTLASHQGVDLAIRAVALLREELPNLRFLIVGKGPERSRLAELIREERLEDRVRILDLVPMEEIAEILSSVDLGVVPKRTDSFGNEAFSTKVMEFMAMRVPVVVSNSKVDRYYFNDGVVRFFEAQSVTDLTEKIRELARDERLREALRSGAWQFVQKNNWDVKRQEYLNLASRLCGNGTTEVPSTAAERDRRTASTVALSAASETTDQG